MRRKGAMERVHVRWKGNDNFGYFSFKILQKSEEFLIANITNWENTIY